MHIGDHTQACDSYPNPVCQVLWKVPGPQKSWLAVTLVAPNEP